MKLIFAIAGLLCLQLQAQHWLWTETSQRTVVRYIIKNVSKQHLFPLLSIEEVASCSSDWSWKWFLMALHYFIVGVEQRSKSRELHVKDLFVKRVFEDRTCVKKCSIDISRKFWRKHWNKKEPCGPRNVKNAHSEWRKVSPHHTPIFSLYINNVSEIQSWASSWQSAFTTVTLYSYYESRFEIKSQLLRDQAGAATKTLDVW